MFHSRTVFVIGAGASKEFGLPLGNELTSFIGNSCDMVSSSFSRTLKQGDQDLFNTMIDLCQKSLNKYQINDLYRAARKISAGMPWAASIDNFIDLHKDDASVAICGKLAIAHWILKAEKKSSLQITQDTKNPTIKPQEIANTWIHPFVRMLQTEVPKSNIENLFDNITIITFNYDRCIEHALFFAIKDLYALSDAESAAVMHRLRIYHPYGQCGYLPWQKNGPYAPFGSESDHDPTEVWQLISTFTEQLADKLILDRIREEISSASKIVFLGFSYHTQNMELLTPQKMSCDKIIYGTAKGFSDDDIRVLEGVSGSIGGPGTVVYNTRPRNLTCSELLKNFSLEIPA